MGNVKGKLVSDGSHNVIYAEASGANISQLDVDVVTEGENVRYKIAGAGEVPAAYVTLIGGASSLYYRPGGIDQYYRPGGVDSYLRP